MLPEQVERRGANASQVFFAEAVKEVRKGIIRLDGAFEYLLLPQLTVRFPGRRDEEDLVLSVELANRGVCGL